MEKKVTPKIKRTRVHTERYDVCPHCKEEIREKASYVDPEGYEYHRQCHDKGPIGKIDLGAKFGIDGFSIPESKTSNVKTAGGLPTERRSGFLEKNVAGKDYQIPWDGTITPSVKDGSQDSVIAEQPANMPEDLWAQIQAIANDEAKKAARKDLTKASVKAAVIQKSANWLDRACLTVVADKAKPAGPSKKNFADVDGPSEDEDEDDDGHHVTAAMKGKPIDETLLADGLGAFLDVFVNYHTGKEGDKLAKWVIEICKDPKYAEVAGKLQEFHKLMGDIYKDVVEIANEDESVRGKVAGVLKRVKTAANRYPLASEFVDALRYEDDKVSDVVIDLILSRYDWTEKGYTDNHPKVAKVMRKFRNMPKSDQEIVTRIVRNEDKYGKVPSLDLHGGGGVLPEERMDSNPSFENAVRALEDVASTSKKVKTAIKE